MNLFDVVIYQPLHERRRPRMELGTVLLIFIGVVLLWLLIDLLLAGGAMTSGMMGGMMMAASTPIGLIILLILLALGALFAYVSFFA
jgi:hypothetical protein